MTTPAKSTRQDAKVIEAWAVVWPHRDSDAILERFVRRIEVSDDGCWLWTGNKHQNGYGSFWLKDRMVRAHRASWRMAHGDGAGAMFVCHKCDVRACIRPDHLFLGTSSDNMLDMWRKERRIRPRGENAYNAKLTEQVVKEIRSMRASGQHYVQIARHFGVSVKTVFDAVKRRSWAHVA